ncbi:hypothetical protein HHI36_024018 [Cryptolaemus montrouzieri]|uniref:Uncharacterized protein n=1 Tax=Cryptolaemus montrouzieri TaxID=559131 RepID=A0ABD2MMG9_9CUCU
MDIVDEDIENCQTGSKVVGARKLNRRKVVEGKVDYVPSGSYLITFEGRILPKTVSIYDTPRERKKKGVEIVVKNTKKVTVIMNNINAFFCKQDCNHASTDRNCPKFRRQKLIKEKMAVENIPYYEAEQYIRDETYAEKDPRNFPTLPRQRMSNDNDQRIEGQDLC